MSFKYIYEKLNKNNKLMTECFNKILIIEKMFPPKKNENKFIYGKLCEKVLIEYLNKIFDCKELDLECDSGSEYKNDCYLFDNDLKIENKFSIKVQKNRSNVTIINKRYNDEHTLSNINFMLINIYESKLYIFSHNEELNKYVKNDNSCISYKVSLLKYLDQNKYYYKFLDQYNYQNIKPFNIYGLLLNEVNKNYTESNDMINLENNFNSMNI
jgi:hypothetical protein